MMKRNNIIKILLLGEGPTDVGTRTYNGTQYKGCVIHLIEKMSAQYKQGELNKFQFELVTKQDINNRDDVTNKHKKKFSTLPGRTRKSLSGHGKNIQKLIQHAALEEMDYDYILYYGDTDKRSGEVSPKKASQEAYAEANGAFEQFNIKGIPIIPLRMIESWLLVDSNCFEGKVKLPKNPELIWGDEKNQTSDHPKNYLQRILTQKHLEPNRQTYCELVDRMSLGTI
jgi:hypothetical protein